MKYNSLICLIFLAFSITFFGQKKVIEINGVTFSFNQVKLDTLESAENKIIELYRGGEKLLTHTVFKEEGDCSSIHIQLGQYQILDDKIIFYSYWAATDRMSGSILPFGYRKQQYSVDSLGFLKLVESKIYIENIVTSENINYFENNGWKHKGLKYLNEPLKNIYEQRLLEDYTQNIENEYNAEFVFNEKKEDLEKEVRNILKEEIKKHTENWIEGEVYGRVKK
ncbi:MAG: hypothetical protein JKY08_07305 [Flavobacteriaceae bacterium]|nr:hypothetical protein [Flavobacteriaceae bacterium]